MKTAGVLLIAGASTRFGASKQKQVCLLNNKPVFSYSLEAFAKSKNIDEIIVVVNEKIENEIRKFLSDKNIEAKIVLGGKTRQESVCNALNSLNLENEDIVLIHDGARPLLEEAIIQNVKNAAIEFGAATTYIKEVDTVAMKNYEGFINSFLNREEVVRIQTPQAFKFGLIKKAHENSEDKTATDDCSLLIKQGQNVKLVEGSIKLHKITTIESIYYLEGLLKNE